MSGPRYVVEANAYGLASVRDLTDGSIRLSGLSPKVAAREARWLNNGAEPAPHYVGVYHDATGRLRVS